ncbi:hypothetical protein D9619_002551 [Psilocybe cf. subviscida]|uniref:Adenosine kinase n=1 Tax=Psilocybe cf. subviscida TaxID=2480587 RepID=A0A8H5AVR5_9AGAR|nr:hypothetical protein D9619_002551 [Psilocybe cf. subviscida]
MAEHTPYPLFCIGHPLLDIQVRNGEALLAKYGLEANGYTLAKDKQLEIYDDIVANHQVTFVAGGGAQNMARGAAYILPPKSVAYTGAVGNDSLAEQLRQANEREGVLHVYDVHDDEKTGACAVVITGHHRSLTTTHRAAQKFRTPHLSSPDVAPLIRNASFYYLEGFFLRHGLEAALEVATKSSEHGKTFILNISAPFVVQHFGAQLKALLPYVDILIGNEAEAAAWATANEMPNPSDLHAIARSLALFPKVNASKPRIVLFTQGGKSTLLLAAQNPDEPRIYPVLEAENLIDTNGAGDAFAGGFAAGLVAGYSLDDSVWLGHELARECVHQVGPQYPWPKVDILVYVNSFIHNMEQVFEEVLRMVRVGSPSFGFAFVWLPAPRLW